MRKILIFMLILLPVFVQAKTYNVGIVGAEGSKQLLENLKSEIEEFVAGTDSAEATVSLYDASKPVEELDKTIKSVTAGADILIFFGEVPAGRALINGLTKPSVAVFETDVDCAAGFNFMISPEINYEQSIQVFKDLFGFKELKVMQSDFATCSSDVCSGSKNMIVNAINVPYEVVDADYDGFEAGDTVLLLEQPQLTDSELKKLLSTLSAKGVRTFSFGGYHDAELGVMAVDSRDKDYQKMSRTTAVAVAEIIAGKHKQTRVKLKRTEGLVINMEAASAADFSPAWEYLRSAEILNYDKSIKYDKYIGFKEALTNAVKNNEDVATGHIDLETAKLYLDMSKSAFRPTFNLSSSYVHIDDDTARIARGTAPEKTLSVSLQLQQIIYSEEVFSLKDQALYNKKAAEAMSRQAELDVMHEAAKAYLQVLRAKTYAKIAQDNLDTTKDNYDLAKNRDLAGAANPAELHRWEARIALSKIDMVNAVNGVKNAMTELARIVSEDIDGVYELEPVSIQNDYTALIGIDQKKGMITNPKSFNKFKKVMVEEAVKNSVELKTLKYLTEAADRAVLSAKRKFYLPTVTAGGEYKKYIDKSGVGDDAGYDWYDDNEWNVGVTASIPLYQGGRRSAKLSVEKASLRKLFHEKAKATKLVRQRMITALENARAAYDSYMLAGESAEAAKKTLSIVSDLYSRGAVSITDLIDTQNAKLNAEMNVASNQYNFMEKVVEVERAYGSFFAFSADGSDNTIMDVINNLDK